MGGFTEVANGIAEAWAAGMWTAVWQSTVLAGGVLLLTRRFRRGPSPLRFWLWMLVPLRLLVMPVVTVPLPVMPAPEPEPVVFDAPMLGYGSGASPVGAAYCFGASLPGAGPDVPAALADGRHQFSAVASLLRLSPFAWLMAAWGLGVALSVTRMAYGWRRAKALVSRGAEVTSGPLFDLACRAARLLGAKRVPRIVVTPERVSPFACGIRRPVVVIPGQFVKKADPAALLAVLTHEFTHLHRRDPLLGLIMAACESLYFFHPVVHFAKRRALFERERACDDFVLAMSGARASAYARALVEAAAAWHAPSCRVGPAAVVSESFSGLRARLAAIACDLRPAARLSTGAVVFLLLMGGLCVPGIALTARKPATAAGGFETALPELAQPADAPNGAVAMAGANPRPSREDGVPVAAGPAAETAPASSAPTRALHFPADRSMGTLFIFTRPSSRGYRLGPEYDALAEWRYLAEARGAVAVPEDARLKLDVASTALRDLSPLAELSPDSLHAITLVCPEDMTADPDQTIMPQLGRLTGLKELSLYRCNITDVGARHLAGLRGLEYLWLSSERLGNTGLASLEGLTSLKVLALHAQVTDRGLRRLTRLTSLRELMLQVDDLHGDGIEDLSLLPSLEFLELYGNGFSDEGLRHLEGLSSLKSLTLFGSDLQITDAGLPHLAQLTGLEELRFVWIKGITDVGMAHLTPLQNLRLLDLHSTQVTDAGIAQLTALQSLEDLTFPAQGPTDLALAHVAKLSKLRRLNTRGFCPVDLTDPGPFTDEGLRHLTSLQDLEELSMCSGIGVTDVGMGYLAQLPSLKRVSLLVNGVTNDGLAKLATVRSLTNVWLHCRGVSVAGVNHLNALENLEFLSMASVVSDGSTLDLSGLSRLDNLTLIVEDKHGRDAKGALRDDDLACLANHTQLRWLQVGFSSRLTDAGMAHLAKLDKLERLSIGGEQVTDAGLQYLADKQAMDLLNVKGDFSKEGLRQLEGLKALRNLTLDTKDDLSVLTVGRLRAALPCLQSLNGQQCQ